MLGMEKRILLPVLVGVLILGGLVNINDGKKNDSVSLNPEFFAERFELNDDF